MKLNLFLKDEKIYFVLLKKYFFRKCFSTKKYFSCWGYIGEGMKTPFFIPEIFQHLDLVKEREDSNEFHLNIKAYTILLNHFHLLSYTLKTEFLNTCYSAFDNPDISPFNLVFTPQLQQQFKKIKESYEIKY